jgi:hypothetical protein
VIESTDRDDVVGASAERKAYVPPELSRVGTLAELTQGFSGSLPDEGGGQTKRNPFTG